MAPSAVAEASFWPSRLQATHQTPASLTCSVMASWYVTGSQILMVPSRLAEARRLASGLQQRDDTSPVCPGRATTSLPEEMSQSVMVLAPPADWSILAEASFVPSGLQAIKRSPSLPSLMTEMTRSSRPELALQPRIVPS